ncbi:MAG: urea transporter, urea binding protein [Firmicutes bacterium]|nr:urea transporter, urea binding protein [Bacillota bacterium]
MKNWSKAKLALAMLLIASLVVLSGCGSQAQTAKPSRDYILIGRVNPTTGPLASFGAGTPFVEEKAIEAINKEGGIYIAEYGKKLPVKLVVVDSESNPTKAAEAANKLIVQDKVDILTAAHTPDTVNPVSAAAERYKIPCITVDSADWVNGGGPHAWAFHAFWAVPSMLETQIDMWDMLSSNKKVGFLYGTDPDGVVMSKTMKEKVEARGYTVVDPGRFPSDIKDFTSIINQFKQENVDIVVGVMTPPDFSTALRQMHQQGYVPKVLTMAKAILFPADVAALGDDLGMGLTSEIWWSPKFPYKSSLTGQTAAELGKMWSDSFKAQAPASVGYKHASVEIVIDVLKRAQSLDKEKIRQAIKETNLDTIIGHIQFNDQNFAETMVVGGQWVKGKEWPWELNIITNKKAPAVPLSPEKIFYLPGTTQ